MQFKSWLEIKPVTESLLTFVGNKIGLGNKNIKQTNEGKKYVDLAGVKVFLGGKIRGRDVLAELHAADFVKVMIDSHGNVEVGDVRVHADLPMGAAHQWDEFHCYIAFSRKRLGLLNIGMSTEEFFKKGGQLMGPGIKALMRAGLISNDWTVETREGERPLPQFLSMSLSGADATAAAVKHNKGVEDSHNTPARLFTYQQMRSGNPNWTDPNLNQYRRFGESFRSWMEMVAAPVKSGGSGTIDNGNNNNDGGDDEGDEWDSDNIRRRFWKTLEPWCRNSQTANVVRFNIYSKVVNKKPQISGSIWAKDGNSSAKNILKLREGYIMASMEWTYPLEGEWDTLVQEQREILSRSDLYKAFGEEGQAGSAALLFKGDVLETVVLLCCSTMPKSEGSTWSKNTSPFIASMIKFINSKWNSKLLEWGQRQITKKIGFSVPALEELPAMGSAVAVAHPQENFLIFKMQKQWKFKF